jgi:serine/threonine-protein kinase
VAIQEAPLRGDLANVVAMALREEPIRRYGSAQALADDVQRYLDGLPVVARKDTWSYRTGKFVRRNRAGVTAASLLLLLIIGFGITVSILLHRSRISQARAEKVTSFVKEIFESPDPAKTHGQATPVSEILDRGQQKINEGLKEEPEVQADFMDTLGTVYGSLGENEKSLKVAQDALRIRRETLASDDPKLAESLHTLGSALRRMGRDAMAEPLVREAVDIQRKNARGDDPELARGLNNLATLLDAKGNTEEAEKLYRQSLDMKRRLYGKIENVEMAMSLNNLAVDLQETGHPADAEPLYREALAMRQHVLTAPNPDIATSLNNLGTDLEDLHDLVGADELYRQAIAMRLKLYGTSPPVANFLNNLARLRTSSGDRTGAEALYRQALQIYTLTANDSPYRGYILRNLAVLVAQRSPAEAEPLAREAVAILRRAMPTSWRPADAESVLGGCLVALHRAAEADPLLTASYVRLAQSKDDGRKHVHEALDRLVALCAATHQEARGAVYSALLSPPILPAASSFVAY